jgi:hypothetical protein
MPANDTFSASRLRDAFIEEDTMTIRELVAKVRRLPTEAVRDLAACLIASQASDEEAEEAPQTISEILSPPVGWLIPMSPPRGRRGK